MDGDDVLREQLGRLLDGAQAHIRPQELFERFPLDRINAALPGVPYPPWQLLEHLRLAQRDILDYVADGDYQELTFPDGYWPAAAEAPGGADEIFGEATELFPCATAGDISCVAVKSENATTPYAAFKCAPGHGGTPVDPADVPLTSQTAASCSAACTATKGCAIKSWNQVVAGS